MKKWRAALSAFLVGATLVGTVGCGDAKEESKGSVTITETAIPKDSGTESTQATNEYKEKYGVPTGHVADKLVVAFGDTTGTGLCTGVFGIAREKGYIQEELKAIGVTYEDIPMVGMGPQINEALAAGSADIGSMGDVIAITGYANGIDTKVIKLDQGVSSSSIVLAPGLENEITSIADLKGKKVQAYQGTFMYKDLIEYLKLGGLTIDDVELVNCNATEAISMLLTGSIDASVNQGYPLVTALNNGGTLLVDGRDEEYAQRLSTSGVTMVRTEFLEENPDIVYAFIKANLRAYKDVLENPELYYEQYVSAGGDPDVFNFDNPEHVVYDTFVPLASELEAERNLVNFMLEENLIETDIDLEEWTSSKNFIYAAFEEVGLEIPE